MVYIVISLIVILSNKIKIIKQNLAVAELVGKIPESLILVGYTFKHGT